MNWATRRIIIAIIESIFCCCSFLRPQKHLWKVAEAIYSLRNCYLFYRFSSAFPPIQWHNFHVRDGRHSTTIKSLNDMIHKWNSMKRLSTGEREGKQTKKEINHKIVWINCGLCSPLNNIFPPSKSFFPHQSNVNIFNPRSRFHSSIHGSWFLLAHKKSHHPLTYCNFYISQLPENGNYIFMAASRIFLSSLRTIFVWNQRLMITSSLVRFVSHSSHPIWVNKLQLNASILCLLSLLQFAVVW